MRHAKGGFVAFLDEVPGMTAHGTTPDETEWNLRLPFAEYVAKERSEGRLCGELRVLWNGIRTEKIGGIWHGYLDGHPEIDERGLTEEIARRKVESVANILAEENADKKKKRNNASPND
jgi:predicted RNase H-like HicB family nuclease